MQGPYRWYWSCNCGLNLYHYSISCGCSFYCWRSCQGNFIGAASSAVTFGIGSAAGNLFSNFFSKAAFQAAAHGTFQGTMTAISGGKFWSGFAAGAISSMAASAWAGGSSMSEAGSNGVVVANTGMSGLGGNFASSGLGMISFGTISGGAGAALTGGNFWQGAVTGLVVSGLNHFVHKIIENNQIYDRLKAAGISDPYAAASDVGLNLREFAIKLFPDMMAYTHNPGFEKKEVINDDPKIRGLCVGSETGGRHTFGNKIFIAKSAFSSYLKLASTIGHELKHASNYFNGNLNAWFRKGGESYRNAMDELQSYQWELNNGGMYEPVLLDNYSREVKLWDKLFNNFK
jgi:hypothetical protein